MEIIISILLWLGVLTPGAITQSDLNELVASHQDKISVVQSDTVLLGGVVDSQAFLLPNVSIIDPSK